MAKIIRMGNENDGMMMRMPEKFAAINRLITRDLNSGTDTQGHGFFQKYNKDQIAGFLRNPYQNEKQIREVMLYIYFVSSHFRRLIQYFASLSDLAYVVSPFKTDTSTARPQKTASRYRRVLNLMAAMNVKDQFEKILTVCLREDVFYGTIWETQDSVIIQQLPSDYCAVSVIEDNVLNVSFDFSYFVSREGYLDMYPAEFRSKYELYRKNQTKMRWQELSAPNSFAIKCNKDILNYAMPPFVGILRELFDLEDYRNLRMAKEEIENLTA